MNNQTTENEISHLENSHHSLLVLIDRLNNLNGGRQVRSELTDMISQRIEEFETGIEALELSISDEKTGVSNRHVVALDKLREDAANCKIKFRKAQVRSKRNAELSWKQERELLFGDRKRQESAGTKNMTKDELIMAKSEDITATLRQVHRMAQAEVAKSELNIEELDASTKSLRQLEGRYAAFDVLLNGSQLLVRHLEEADKWDRIYMLASMGFLALVLVWIIWRRILKGPIMLLLWTFFKTVKLVEFVGRKGKSASITGETVQQSIDMVYETVTGVVESTIMVDDSMDGVIDDNRMTTSILMTVASVTHDEL